MGGDGATHAEVIDMENPESSNCPPIVFEDSGQIITDGCNDLIGAIGGFIDERPTGMNFIKYLYILKQNFFGVGVKNYFSKSLFKHLPYPRHY